MFNKIVELNLSRLLLLCIMLITLLQSIIPFESYSPLIFPPLKDDLGPPSVSFPLGITWPSFFCLPVEEVLSVFWLWPPQPTFFGALLPVIPILLDLPIYCLSPVRNIPKYINVLSSVICN